MCIRDRLTPDEVVLNNVPMLADVLSMADLLRAFGADVEIDRPRAGWWYRLGRSHAPPRHQNCSGPPARRWLRRGQCWRDAARFPSACRAATRSAGDRSMSIFVAPGFTWIIRATPAPKPC